jgi:hypothetical protein
LRTGAHSLSCRYALERPYWEAVLLVKKLLLVCASSTFITEALTQAGIGCGVNLVYLALLEVKKPMPYRPSTSAWFQGQNFFHLAERSSASTSLAGSLLALLGATNRSLVDVLGTVFAVTNITYVRERCCAIVFLSERTHSDLLSLAQVRGRIHLRVREELRLKVQDRASVIRTNQGHREAGERVVRS